MPGWGNSTRLATLPADWAQRRKFVAERAGWRCEATDGGIRCGRRGTDCDHTGDRDDHRVESLQWLCRPHHSRKTIGQRTPWRERRDPEPHPGTIR